MIKRILSFFKKVLASIFILYGYNMIASPLGFIIPINFITIGLLSLFGIPMLFAFIFLLVVVF